ncbi:MAG: OmpA family protein [Bacteroidetes bacterium]|nr:OmpA family protein [Bacteroidota bacterium]
MKKLLLVAFVISSAFVSCVPARKYQETLEKQKKCEDESANLKSSNLEMETELTENRSSMRAIQKKITQLEGDTALNGNTFRMLNSNYGKLNETYELLLLKNRDLLAGSAAESAKLSGQLHMTQEELLKKEDALKIMERELDLKKGNLEMLNIELQAREKRVDELESILKKQEAAVNDLRKKVSAALLGFEGDGLTIEQRNGKVYVSLDEKLLFASGSTKVESKGVEAIKKLATVLEQNPDINVLIEGHTDDVPMSGSGAIKDNWDLSVIRATSIVKIIAQNSKVDPKRLLAAGRGEYMPIDPAKTTEARRKNRRTEIILSPKLDELLQLLETN